MTVSPDRRWVAVSRGNDAGSEIYLIDTRTHVERRFTDRSGNPNLGAFSPDSRTLYWADTAGDGRWWLLRQPIDGSAPVDSVTSLMDTLVPQAITADGRYLFATYWSRASAWDIGRIDLQADEPQITMWMGGPGSQLQCRPSPDGRWITYFAAESGQRYLYLRRYPDTGAVWELSSEGLDWRGMNWAADSGSLLICNDAGVQRIRIEETDGMLDIRPVESLVAARLVTSAANNTGFWPLPDGSGAYMLQPASNEVIDDAQTVLVTNWVERLAARFANQATPPR
jgi:Tol biopolymer transport system component